jgi:hypothetical protein
MATFCFSLKTTNYIKTLSFLLIPLNWCSNACLHLLASGPFEMVYLQGETVFTLKIQQVDSLSMFSYCIRSLSTPNSCVFGAACLLAMTKPSDGICPIAVGETLYQFTIYALCFQFHEAFATHFSSHQFRVSIKGGYETIIHGIRCTLDLHHD